MESEHLMHIFSTAFRYLLIAGFLVFVYKVSNLAANTSRSKRNPPLKEKVLFMIKGAGVLLIISLVLSAGGNKDDDDDESLPIEAKQRRMALIFITSLPVMIFGMSDGYSREKQENLPPPDNQW